jgi:prophage antirepressor-like protein
MNTGVQIFKNEMFGEVRVTEVNGQIMFAATEIAKCLGYENPNEAILYHCKSGNIEKCYIAHGNGIGGINVNFIPESEVYRLITHSKLPTAEKFQDWVFDEVLPSIRKHGAYLTPQKTEELLMNPDLIIQLATLLKAEREEKEHMQLTNEAQQKQLALQAPKVALMDKILDAEQKIDVGQAAKILGLPFGRNTLFVKLREKGIFFKNRNEPKQKYIVRGYFELKEKWIDREHHDGFMVVKVLVTQKGLDFLSRLFEVVPTKKQIVKIQ